MSFLVRFEAVTASGEVLQDETMVAEVAEIEKLEKRLYAFGVGDVTLRITFDPPLSPRVAQDNEESVNMPALRGRAADLRIVNYNLMDEETLRRAIAEAEQIQGI